jgi:hypothetical protein
MADFVQTARMLALALAIVGGLGLLIAGGPISGAGVWTRGRYGAAMLKEGTFRKYFSLRAVEPRSRRPLIEKYATSDQADARRAALEQAGYTVIVTLAETVEFGGEDHPTSAGKPPW